jgi:hypothetical protein
MIKKVNYMLFIALSLLSLRSLAQDAAVEPEYLSIKWKVGTEKRVTSIDTSFIFVDGELMTTASSKTSYKIKILSLKDTIYEIRYSHITNASAVDISGDFFGLKDSIIAPVLTAFANLEKAISKFDFVVLVDKNSGSAFEIKNEKEYLNLVNKLVFQLLEDLIQIFGDQVPTYEKNKVKKKIEEEMTSKSKEILETALNSLNYFLQLYSFPYVTNDVHTSEMEFHDIDQIRYTAMTYHGDVETHAKKEGNFLKMKSIYHLNKQELYEVMKQQSDDPNDFVSIQEFAVFQETNTTFDVRSTWITAYTSVMDVILGAIQVKEVTYMRVE